MNELHVGQDCHWVNAWYIGVILYGYKLDHGVSLRGEENVGECMYFSPGPKIIILKAQGVPP